MFHILTWIRVIHSMVSHMETLTGASLNPDSSVDRFFTQVVVLVTRSCSAMRRFKLYSLPSPLYRVTFIDGAFEQHEY